MRSLRSLWHYPLMFSKVLSVFAMLVLCSMLTASAAEPRILFIGNSYTGVNNLPQIA